MRELLLWFRAERRGTRVVEAIDRALEDVDLRTEPHFHRAWIDAHVRFVPRHARLPTPPPTDLRDEGSSPEADRAPLMLTSTSGPIDDEGCAADDAVVVGGDGDGDGGEPQGPTTAAAAAADPALRAALEDPTYLIGRLEAANRWRERAPTSVAPDAGLEAALTLMMTHELAHLPVMTSPHTVKGLVTWRSVALTLGLRRSREARLAVRDCMIRHHEVSEEDSLFGAIAVIAANECVLVRGGDRRIIGLVTTTDLASTFGSLGEPFLLLGEIEAQIRGLLRELPLDVLQRVRPPGSSRAPITSVADLTFGDYVRLLEDPTIWAQIGMPLDRPTFVRELDRIREIRNDVMHFDPEGLEPERLIALRRLSKVMQQLREVGAFRRAAEARP